MRAWGFCSLLDRPSDRNRGLPPAETKLWGRRRSGCWVYDKRQGLLVFVLREAGSLGERVLHLWDRVVQGVVMDRLGVQRPEAFVALHWFVDGLFVGHVNFIDINTLFGFVVSAIWENTQLRTSLHIIPSEFPSLWPLSISSWLPSAHRPYQHLPSSSLLWSQRISILRVGYWPAARNI